MQRPRFKFSQVRHIPVGEWTYGGMLKGAHSPGDLLLTGPAGESGGFLILTNNHGIHLTKENVYYAAPFNWPGLPYSEVWLRGNTLQVDLRQDSAPRTTVEVSQEIESGS